MMKRFCWAGLSLCLAAHAAHATTVVQCGPQTEVPIAPVARGVPLRVQVSYQLSVPASRDAVDEQKATILATHGALYAMAAQECDRLRTVIPGECRLVSLSLNNGTQFYNPQTQAMSFGANATLELTTPAEPAPPPAH